jgi:curved DNA-binding protein CbpA
VILGVSPDVTDEQLKERFRELARTLHPDMPTGDAKRFKEVNAAYAVFKAQRVKGMRDDGHVTNDSSADSEDAMAERMREHMRRYHEERARGRPRSHQEMMWDDEVYEILVMGASWFFAVIFVVDWTLLRWKSSQRDDLVTMAAAMRSSTVPVPTQLVAPSEVAKDYTDKTSAAYYNRQRRSHQQSFQDLREFFLIYDTDFVADRRFSLQKISSDRIDEQRIAPNCGMVLRINSSSNPRAYDKAVMDAVGRVDTTNWRWVDAGPTTGLTLEALKRIPKHHPSDYRVTFVEYGSDREQNPRCMVAILNDRYLPGTGNAQRAIVTGKDDFHANLALNRMREMQAGDLKVEDLVQPGWVPVLDKKA